MEHGNVREMDADLQNPWVLSSSSARSWLFVALSLGDGLMSLAIGAAIVRTGEIGANSQLYRAKILVRVTAAGGLGGHLGSGRQEMTGKDAMMF